MIGVGVSAPTAASGLSETNCSTGAETAAGPESPETEPVVRIYLVNHHEQRKPMTLDEAILEIDARPYIVYRGSEKDSISVLIRREDGNFDLVES